MNWIVTEVDGRIASISADYRYLAKVSAEVAALSPEEVDEERERMALQDAQVALSEHMAYKDYVLTQLAFAQAFNKLRVKKHADSGGANVQNNAM